MEFGARITVLVLLVMINGALSGPHERRLMDKINKELSGFNMHERPSEDDDKPLKVEMGLTLQQIIDVHEKDQIIYTNMWITMKWNDYKLRWNPADYGNITQISLPSDLVWKPDILMYNSAADSFDASFQSRLRVDHDGETEQIPPGMFKSTCKINIRWFPFDAQDCEMKFGSWTYDGMKVDLRFLDGIPEGSMVEFTPNGEWTLVGIPAKRNVITYECCPQNPFIDLTYTIQIRRRKLYYVVNIVGPCMLFALLGLFTFCLPPDAGEKISFSVTVLLSLTVFMMIVSDTLPATSEAIPLIAVYFMGIMVMTAISIVATITSINFHHRNADTHKMSKFVKITIGDWLAWVLRMQRPGTTKPPTLNRNAWRKHSDLQMLNVNASQSLLANVRGAEADNDNFYSSFAASTPNIAPNNGAVETDPLKVSSITTSTVLPSSTTPTASNYNTLASSSQPLARFELRAILKELRYLTGKHRDAEEDDKIRNDWQWCAMVLDRLFIWIVGILNAIIAAAVLLSAPDLFA